MRLIPPLRGSFPWFLVLAAGALASPFARLSGEVGQGIAMNPDAEASIRVTAINSFWDGLGWEPVLVRIENRAQRPQSWRLEFNASNYNGLRSQVTTSAEIAVPARSTKDTVVLVPGPGRSDASGYTTSLRVQANGPGVEGQPGGLTKVREINFGLVAFSPRAELGVRRTMGSLPSAGGPPAYELESVDPAQWPADWRVWSSFSNVVLTGDDYDALDGARRNALREWVAQGGVLMLDRKNAVPGEPAVTPVGLGRIYNRGYDLPNVARANGNQRVAPWLAVAPLLDGKERARWALDKPIAALVIFLLGFGLLAGPVNVFILAPASRRHRLFITVPALSVGAALLLGAVIVMKDGFGGEGTRRSLVMLLPGENKAVVFQQQVARTGVLLRKEFPLPADTLLSVGAGGSSGVNSEKELERDGDTAGGAWFASRTTQSHDLRRITPTRARVEIVAGGTDGAAPVVQSSVTAVLSNFRYVDAAGGRWIADEVPPGRRVTLTATGTVDAGDVRGVFRAYGTAGELAPLATHASIKWRDDTIIYTGRVESARQP